MNVAQKQAIGRTKIADGIEHIILDQPDKSANVITKELQAELAEVIGQLERSPPSIGVIISSAKPGIYIAGADIVAISKTLDWSQQQIIEFCRTGQSLFDRLSKLPCLVVAAIHGVCVGGGMEFALACDARVATNDRKTLLGLPEVKLGLIPGWAGTVRTPRLIGLGAAIELVTTGKLISAEQSRALGLVDAVIPADRLIDEAAALARDWKASGTHQRRRQQLRDPVADRLQAGDLQATFAAAIAANSELHALAPTVALTHLLDSAGDSFDVACEKEAVAMSRVYGSESNAALLNAFFLNERVKKLGRFSNATPAKIENVGIAGAGLMGGDIALVCPPQTALRIYDLDSARASAVAARCNSRPKISAAAQSVAQLSELASCQLVVESIVEDVAAKRSLLVELERNVGHDAILASNTSVIRIGELGEGLRRPERFCGLHFCYPAQTRRLVEVVRGPFTSDATMATACEWVRSCGKIPLPVGDAPGFVINRLLCPMFNEVGHLLTQGCSPSSIEAAAREFGFVRGPLEFMDAIGLDTLYAAGAYLIPRLTTPTEPSLLLHAMNKVGWKGRKSGRGFYAYATPTSAPEANPELAPLVAQYSKGSRKQLVADEINKRLLMVMVNQAVDVLAEKVVADESEIDLAVLHGIGFPDYRGGLLFWTRHYGLKKLVEQMQQWCSDSASPRRYRLSPNLCQLVAAG